MGENFHLYDIIAKSQNLKRSVLTHAAWAGLPYLFLISSQLTSDTAARPFFLLCGIRPHQFVSCKYPTLSWRLALNCPGDNCRIKKKRNLTFKRSRKQLVHNKSPVSKCSEKEKVDIIEIVFFFQQKRSFSEFGTDSLENLVS